MRQIAHPPTTSDQESRIKSDKFHSASILSVLHEVKMNSSFRSEIASEAANCLKAWVREIRPVADSVEWHGNVSAEFDISNYMKTRLKTTMSLIPDLQSALSREFAGICAALNEYHMTAELYPDSGKYSLRLRNAPSMKVVDVKEAIMNLATLTEELLGQNTQVAQFPGIVQAEERRSRSGLPPNASRYACDHLETTLGYLEGKAEEFCKKLPDAITTAYDKGSRKLDLGFVISHLELCAIKSDAWHLDLKNAVRMLLPPAGTAQLLSELKDIRDISSPNSTFRNLFFCPDVYSLQNISVQKVLEAVKSAGWTPSIIWDGEFYEITASDRSTRANRKLKRMESIPESNRELPL